MAQGAPRDQDTSAPRPSALARIRASAPWAFNARFMLGALAAFAVVGVAGMVVGYVATKRLVPYHIRIGVVEPAVHAVRTWLGVPERIAWTRVTSHFGTVETAAIPIIAAGHAFPASVEDLSGNLLVMDMEGAFFYMTPGFELRSLDMTLPMNRDGLGELASRPNYNPQFFRAHDMLAVPAGPGAFDLYASYDRFTGACFEIAVARRRVTTTDEGVQAGGDWQDVFVAHPCAPPQTNTFVVGGHQVGGRLTLLDADTLLLSLGDMVFDGDHGYPDGPQDPNWDLGKIIAISLTDGSAERYAMGFRNPQGLLVDSQGRIWESEHGPQGGDEVNLVRRGGNYGWPLVTYGVPYSEPASAHTRFGSHDGFERPAMVFTPAIGPSQFIEPSTEQFPFWRSSILLATLRGSAIFVLRIEDDRIVFAEPIPLGARIRDILSRPNGEIAMVTEVLGGGGGLMLMRPVADGRESAPFEVADLRTRAASATPAAATAADAGRLVFQQACATCHSASGEGGAGPSLAGVVGRDIGSVEGFGYSETLAGARGNWTPQRLRSFLVDPDRDFSGTAMPDSGVTRRQADDVIAYLQASQ